MVGTFYLKPDSLRLGAHVANSGYVGACRRSSGWQRNGFEVVSTLPGAFSHKQLGYVDALVMVQGLVEGPTP